MFSFVCPAMFGTCWKTISVLLADYNCCEYGRNSSCASQMFQLNGQASLYSESLSLVGMGVVSVLLFKSRRSDRAHAALEMLLWP